MYFAFKNKFFLLAVITSLSVFLTPVASFAANAPTFLNPIEIKSEFNIAQVAQSLTSLALLSVFLERAIEIVSKILDKDKIIMPEAQRAKWIPFFTLLVGIGISAIGIRGLEPFFSLNNDLQGSLFRLVDIILTGTLISGGTAGIHEILTSLTAFLDVTKVSAEAGKAKAEAEKASHELATVEHEKALKIQRGE
jgi:hypothetical protein